MSSSPVFFELIGLSSFLAYRRFGQEVGWNVDNRWLNYKELSWGEPKIKGHLPDLRVVHGVLGAERGLFSRAASCEL